MLEIEIWKKRNIFLKKKIVDKAKSKITCGKNFGKNFWKIFLIFSRQIFGNYFSNFSRNWKIKFFLENLRNLWLFFLENCRNVFNEKYIEIKNSRKLTNFFSNNSGKEKFFRKNRELFLKVSH